MSRVRSGVVSSGQDLVGICIILLSALLIGIAPSAAKVAYKEGANLLAVITFRTVIGAFGLALYLLARQQWPKHELTQFRRSAFSGLAQVLTTIGFIGAVAFIDVSMAALIFYFHPFLVAVIGHFRGDLRLTPALIAWIAAAIAGLALVFGVTFTSLSAAGIGLSIVGMIAITILIFVVADVSSAVGPIRANFYMTTWSSIYVLLFALLGSGTGLVDEMLFPLSIHGWLAILGAGVTTTAGYVLFFVGARRIGTTRAAVWTVTEPLFAILFAILLVHEWLTPLQWLGVAIVIGSLIKFETAGRSSRSE